MKKRELVYEGEEITVTWDKERCIHAGACVRGLPAVFDTSRKRWIMPDKAAADDVANTVETCPTGALHYRMKEGSRQEQRPSRNRIRLDKNGPVYLHGDIEIQDAEGTRLLEDTRVALCRCGASENKPLCDDKHKKIGFKADTDADTYPYPEADKGAHKPMVVKLMKNGPALVEGRMTIESDSGTHTTEKTVALCRCGQSSNKPFCDGTHKDIGFQSS